MMQNWWDKDEVVAPRGGGMLPSSLPRVVVPPRPDPYRASADARAERADQRASRAEGRAAAEAAKPNLPPGYRMGANGVAERIPGLPTDNPDTNDQKLEAKRANLDSLVGQINRVEELYRQNIEGQPVDRLFGLTEMLPTATNRQFDAAGAGLAEQGLSAFRVPGVGSQSDAELRQFIQANKPTAWDYDKEIEEKMRQLRMRVDATRKEMGLPPAQWGAPQQDDRGAAIAGQQGGGPTGGGGPSSQSPPGNVDYSMMSQGGFAYNPLAEAVKPGAQARTEFDPERAALIDGLIRKGVPYTKAFAAVRRRYPEQAPWDPKTYNAAMAHARQNPGYKGSYAYADREVPLSGVEKARNYISQSTPGAALGQYANAATGGIPAALAGDEGRYTLDLMREKHPTASTVGEVGGAITGMIGAGKALKAAAPALQGVPIVGPALANPVSRNMIGDATYGAVSGATSNPDNPVAGAAIGAGMAGAGSYGGQKLVSGVGRAVSGARDAGTRYLTERGIPLTIGDIAGKGGIAGRAIKGVESKLESVPFLGDAIKARRLASYEAMNREASGQALDPIGARAQASIGEQGVEAARTATGDAYTQALSNVKVTPDMPFVRHISAAVQKGRNLPGSLKESFASVIREYVAPALENGTMTGEAYQAVRQALRRESATWRGAPNGHAMTTALKQVEVSLEGLVRRQAPDVVPALNKADQAYKRAKVIENAVGRGVNTGGVFTPAQLGMAARQNANKFGGDAATTERPFFDLQRHAQDTLPSTVPNSGTIDRAWGSAILPAALGGAGYGLGLSPEQIALLASLGLPYTQAGMAMAQTILARRPDIVRKFGQGVSDNARIGGLIAAPLALGASSGP